jgi:hypothetical protein
MAAKYQPPKQKVWGQIVDSVFLLVLVYLSLLVPLLLNSPGDGEKAAKQEMSVTWQSLQQNPTMQAQWEKLGYTPEKAKPIIDNKFDYSVDPIWLSLTVAVIVGYFVFVLRTSEKEYRQVIAEKFDSNDK